MTDKKERSLEGKKNNKSRQKREKDSWLLKPRKGGKSLWDWISLLPVPILTAWITTQATIHTSNKQIKISTRQNEILEQREQAQRNINQQALLNEYQKDISKLAEQQQSLTKEEGFKDQKTSARAKTLFTLKVLDGIRRGELIQYLADAQLIRVENPIIDLWRADLSDANLKTTDLRKTNLSQTLLLSSNFWGANLIEADLSRAILVEANFQNASLEGANLSRANLSRANFIEAKKIVPAQIKSACNWNTAKFSDEFKEKLNREPDQKVNCDI